VDKVLVMLSFYGEARLTGTGACVFLQFASEDSARAVYEELKNDAEDVYFAAGVARSPVYQNLDCPSF
jgi:4-diphosphocytidyl-2-C-methyl-D-erythritol kinase